MIEVEHLTKHYGSVEAVRDISFRVDEGSIVGFLGPNGAGKSTTLRILAGFLGATSGRVRIGGHDIATARLGAVRKLGYMPETSPLYPELRVREYLSFRAELKRIGRPARKREIERVLALAGVAEMADVLVGHLSKGYRQRTGLADALLGSPPLLILDEPSAGLDPNQIRELRAVVRQLGERHTVLLSTHILSEVEAVCSRALVISEGRLVADGPIGEICRGTGEASLGLTVRGDLAQARKLCAEHASPRRLEHEPLDAGAATHRLTLWLDRDADLGETAERLVSALAGASIGVREVVPATSSLEQVFSLLTGGATPPSSEDER
jgi:ABC-2 type transport system ATP-binding protein